jgi:hypothetical protein
MNHETPKNNASKHPPVKKKFHLHENTMPAVFEFLVMLVILTLVVVSFLTLPGCATRPISPACPSTPRKLEMYGEKINGDDFKTAYKRCADRHINYCVQKIEKRPNTLLVECSAMSD